MNFCSQTQSQRGQAGRKTLQVMVNPGLDEINRTSFQYDFGYEHMIAREYGLSDSHRGGDTGGHRSSASSKDLSSLQVDTEYLPSMCASCACHRPVKALSVVYRIHA